MNTEQLNKQLIHAATNGNLKIIKYLVEQGADIHADNDYALRLASSYGKLEIIKYLVEKGSNIYMNNNSALRRASQSNQLEIIQYFLFYCEMEINQKTKNWLIEKNKKEVLQLIEKRDLLLKLDQDVTQKDSIDNLNKKVKI